MRRTSRRRLQWTTYNMEPNWIFVNNIFPSIWLKYMDISRSNMGIDVQQPQIMYNRSRMPNLWLPFFAAAAVLFVVAWWLSLLFSYYSALFSTYWQDEFLYSIENNNLFDRIDTSKPTRRVFIHTFIYSSTSQWMALMILLLLLAVISRLWNHICLWVIELNKKFWWMNERI